MDAENFIKRRKEQFAFHEYPVWNEEFVDGQFVHSLRPYGVGNPAFHAFIKKEMESGHIKPHLFKPRKCNRCREADPVPGMGWCARCGIKHNLALRLQDDPNLDRIRENISLFKRLIKAPLQSVESPDGVSPDGVVEADGYEELLEVYEENIDAFED